MEIMKYINNKTFICAFEYPLRVQNSYCIYISILIGALKILIFYEALNFLIVENDF